MPTGGYSTSVILHHNQLISVEGRPAICDSGNFAQLKKQSVTSSVKSAAVGLDLIKVFFACVSYLLGYKLAQSHHPCLSFEIFVV